MSRWACKTDVIAESYTIHHNLIVTCLSVKIGVCLCNVAIKNWILNKIWLIHEQILITFKIQAEIVYETVLDCHSIVYLYNILNSSSDFNAINHSIIQGSVIIIKIRTRCIYFRFFKELCCYWLVIEIYYTIT